MARLKQLITAAPFRLNIITMSFLNIILFVLATSSLAHSEETIQHADQIVEIIVEIGDEVFIEGNLVRFTFNEADMILVYDERADRMRIMSPIIPLAEVEADMLVKAMQANFSSVLDARYAISGDTLWSAFLYPISQLTRLMVLSAIQQVSIASVTFGTEYSSGAGHFGVRPEKNPAGETTPESDV